MPSGYSKPDETKPPFPKREDIPKQKGQGSSTPKSIKKSRDPNKTVKAPMGGGKD